MNLSAARYFDAGWMLADEIVKNSVKGQPANIASVLQADVLFDKFVRKKKITCFGEKLGIRLMLPRGMLEEVTKFCHKVHEARFGRDKKNKDRGPARLERELSGKVFEVGVGWLLGKKVDMEIRATGKIQFDADFGNMEHCKACGFPQKHKINSWMCETKDPVYCANDPDEGHIIHLGYAEGITGVFEYLGTVRAVDIAEHMWVLPKSSLFLGRKMCILYCPHPGQEGYEGEGVQNVITPATEILNELATAIV